jgi:hypothetical protein
MEKSKHLEVFLMLLVLFCAYKTSTIDFVDFYDILTAENVGTTNPRKYLIFG